MPLEVVLPEKIIKKITFLVRAGDRASTCAFAPFAPIQTSAHLAHTDYEMP